MKKKFLLGLAFAALAAGGCLIAGNNNAGYDLTPEQIANLDALTQGEPLVPPCNNVSGYRAWKSDSPAPYSKQNFRDCCYEKKKGYDPVGCTENL